VEQHTRVKVIVMLNEDPNYDNNPEVDEEISESAVESFRQGWRDVITGNTLPVSQLWEGIDAE
jgi:hypothetical protein